MKTKKRGANWRATRRYRTGLEIDDVKNNRRRCCVHNNKDGHYMESTYCLYIRSALERLLSTGRVQLTLKNMADKSATVCMLS